MLEKIKSRITALPPVRRYTALALVLAITLTVAFIVSNSMKTPVASTADSDAVKDFISSIIPPESDLGQLILNNIRKIAHFTEYGLIGIELACLLAVVAAKRKTRYISAAKGLIFALIIAFIDETIQIFSSRGPSISDVWIDIGGFFTYSLLTHLAVEAALIIKYAYIKQKQKRNLKNGKNN